MNNVQIVQSKVTIANALDLGTLIIRGLSGRSLNGNVMGDLDNTFKIHLRNSLVKKGVIVNAK